MQDLIYEERGRVILYSFVEFAFTFHGANLIILYFSNKRFAKELRIVCSLIKTKAHVVLGLKTHTSSNSNPTVSMLHNNIHVKVVPKTKDHPSATSIVTDYGQ